MYANAAHILVYLVLMRLTVLLYYCGLVSRLNGDIFPKFYIGGRDIPKTELLYSLSWRYF